MSGLVFGAVLAGGLSSRMGRDKRFLPFEGETWIDRAERTAREAIGGDGARIFLCGEVPDRECLPDSLPGRGPLGGILSALERAGTLANGEESRLLVLPVDMPFLSAPLLHRLLEEAPRDERYSAVVFEEFEMPFSLRCGERSRVEVLALLRAEEPAARSIRNLLHVLGAHRLPLSGAERASLRNVNSPEDLE